MSDRELLEAAARAAGIDGPVVEAGGMLYISNEQSQLGIWAPLTDDGDAFRLAVKLRLVILLDEGRARIGPCLHYPELPFDEDMTEAERCEVVRRAIVMTASAIGGTESEGERG